MYFTRKSHSALPSAARLSRKANSGRHSVQQATKAAANPGGNIAHDFGSLPLLARSTPRVQAKLMVNQPGDRLEQEADRMAERAVGIPSWQTPIASNPSRQSSSFLQQQEMEGVAMRKAADGAGFEASPILTHQLSHQQGGGSPLPSETRLQMEQALGADFSSVRLHTGSQAAEMSQGIQARAFTHGSDIYFNQGQYNPAVPEGRRLLGHELAHVVQQGESNKKIQRDDVAVDQAAAEEAKKKAALITKIKAQGIKAVEDGDASFTSVELDLVDKALTGLPAADKAAIKEAKIIRVQSLGPTTAGRYSNTQGYNDTTPTDEQKIELSNRAFGATSAAESIRVITHEVGHAIAAMPHRVAMSAVVKEGVKSNKLIDEENVAVGEFNTANDASNAAIDVSNAAVLVYNEAIKGSDKAAIAAAKADMDAKKAETARLQKITSAKEGVHNTKKAASDAQKTVLTAKETAAQAKIANIDDLKTDAATKLTTMQTAFTAAQSQLQANDAPSADYRASITTVEEAIKKFYDENVTADVDESTAESAKSAVDTAIQDRNSKRDNLNKADPKNTVAPAMAALETAQDSCLKAAIVVAFNKSMNLSVKKFYDFIVSNGIPTTLTTYASANWPHKPEEFYAEAYSFFVTKPKDLETYSKPLFEWFKSGKYK